MNTDSDPWHRYGQETTNDARGDHRVDSLDASTSSWNVSPPSQEDSSELLRHLTATATNQSGEGGDPTRRHRGVSWVRPSTLMAHGTERLAERGITWGTRTNQRAHDWTVDRFAPVRDHGHDAAQTVRATTHRLAPRSAFGIAPSPAESLSRTDLGR